MSSTRTSSEDEQIRKVGIQVDICSDNSNYPQKLLKMDLTLSIQEILAHLCKEYGVNYERGKYGIWITDEGLDGTKYITDNNKWKIQNGAILVMKESSEILASKLYKLLIEHEFSALQELADLSTDIIVLKEVCQHKSVYKKILERCLENNDDLTWCNGLKIILNMLKQKLVRRICTEIVSRLTWIMEHHNMVSDELLLICMEMLMFIRRYKRLRYQEDLFSHLHQILGREGSRKLQEVALELMNYLVYFPNDLDEEQEAMRNVVTRQVVGTICEKILMAHGPLSKKMQQQLYRYQSLTFRRYWAKKISKIPKSDPNFKKILDNTLIEAKEVVVLRQKPSNSPASTTLTRQPSLLRNLRASFRISRQDLVSSRFVRALSPPRKERTSSSVFYTKPFSFGFYGPIRKSADGAKASTSKESSIAFSKASSLSSLLDKVPEDSNAAASETPPMSKSSVSLLTVDNLMFLAKNDASLYQKWNFHLGQRYHLAEKISQMLCRLLEVGRPRPFDEPCENYHPLAFHTYPCFLEELFCEALAQYEMTSKEMKARVESDESKVIAILQQQIKYALGSKSQTMENFKLVLSGTAYEAVAEKKWAEVQERLRFDLLHKPIFLEYREHCTPRILEMIRKNRLKFLKRGQKLPRVSSKGELQKGVYDQVSLSSSGDSIIIEGIAKISVSDIVDIQVGKTSNFYREIRKYQDDHDIFFKTWRDEQHFWPLLFSIKVTGDIYYNFCAKIEVDLHYWQDGIYLLLNKPMKSETFRKELQMLLDMEVRLHFLDAEGLPIPDEPPEVPPLPTDFNFCSKKALPARNQKLQRK